MKTKLKKNKLSLTRTTIAQLNEKQMNSANGGDHVTEWCSKKPTECENDSLFGICITTLTNDPLYC